MPHVGKAELPNRINLEAGQAKPITVWARGVRRARAALRRGMPPSDCDSQYGRSMEASPAERGRLERYVGKPQTATLMLSAAEDAVPSSTRPACYSDGNRREAERADPREGTAGDGNTKGAS